MSEGSAVGGRRSAGKTTAAAGGDFDPNELPAILALRALLATLDPAGPPRAVVVVEATVPPRPPSLGGAGPAPSSPAGPDALLRRGPRVVGESAPPSIGGRGGAAPAIGILAGSFDPPTNAHLALARAALDGGSLDAIYLALSRHTVDKEGRARPTQADRALILRHIARTRPRHGLLLFNRGLYADQALAARAAFPRAGAIRVVVGFDKARQIFDPRYYADRDAALRQLFDSVSLLVAPRGADGATALAALLDRPENAPFRSRVQALPFDPAYAADSSTAVRARARAGQSVERLVPPEAARFIAETGAYEPPLTAGDRYAAREAMIAALEARAEQAGDPRTEVPG